MLAFSIGRLLDRGAGAQHSSVVVLGEVGVSGSLVVGIADEGVFVPVLRADVAGEHRAGRDADTEIDW